MVNSFPFRICALFALLALWSSFANGATIPITAGQLVNIRVGNGTTAASSTGLPVTLDVYNVTYTSGLPTGIALAQSIPLPTATSGSPPTSGNRYLTQGGTASGEGGLTLSLDGKYMALVGYNNIVGAATNGTGNNGQRVVGILDLSAGTVDTTTDYADTSTSSAIRNAYTTDGTNIWTANSAGGVRYITIGGSTSTPLTGTGVERRVYIYPTASGNQLFTTRQTTTSGGISGVATVGSPPPPTSGTPTLTELPGMPVATATESAYDYFFADANTLYVADDDSSPSLPGGLQKWTFDSSTSTWTRVYNLQVNPTGAATKGIKSLAGMVDASGNVTLFGATTDTTANYLYGFSDTLANTSAASVTATKLIDASTFFDTTNTKWNLRGVAIAPLVAAVPEPTTASLLVLGFSVYGRAIRRRRARQVVGKR